MPEPTEPTPGHQGAKPLVVAVDMGYGHLRAARPIARALGVGISLVDGPPLAGPEERRVWDRVRTAYEWTSRASQFPYVGRPFRWALDSVTDIPHLHPYRDLSAPTRGVATLDRLVRGDLGRGLVARMKETGESLVATFYSPAIAADAAGLRNVWCVVTDSDINRVWAPRDAARTGIRYLVPSPRAGRRLRSYGVPEGRIAFTGFPLPHELVGGRDLPVLRRNLAARLVRLDPAGSFRRDYREELAHFLGPLPEEKEEARPFTLVFAVGGAGAQAGMAARFLPGMREPIEEGRLRLVLVAGVRGEVEARFREEIRLAGLEGALGNGLEILRADSLEEYFDRFDATLAGADALWTKPSELSFYAALGLPLVFAPPVGVHERYNRRWVRESGAGLVQRDPAAAWQWLSDWMEDGTLAGAAWSGFIRLPKHGLHRILDEVASGREG